MGSVGERWGDVEPGHVADLDRLGVRDPVGEDCAGDRPANIDDEPGGHGLVLAENTHMLALARELGFHISKIRGEAQYELRANLKPENRGLKGKCGYDHNRFGQSLFKVSRWHILC